MSTISRTDILVTAEGAATDASSVGEIVIPHDSRFVGHDDLIAEVDAILRPAGLTLVEDEDGGLVVARMAPTHGDE